MNVCEHRARHVRTDSECEHLAGRGPRSITLDELVLGREAGRRIAVSLFVRDTPLLSTTHTCRFKQVTAVQGHRARRTRHPQTRQLNAESASFVLKPGSRTGSFLCKECSFDVALKARPWAVGLRPGRDAPSRLPGTLERASQSSTAVFPPSLSPASIGLFGLPITPSGLSLH